MQRPTPLERAYQLDAQRALIERARDGDGAAQRALHEAHVDRIYRLTFRLTGHEHMARELTQDTFVLLQLPRREGMPALLEVARANSDQRIRGRALFWLGQSGDPRALNLIETILRR